MLPRPQPSLDKRGLITALRQLWESHGKLPFADKADDVFGRLHGLGGDGAGAVRTVDQDGIDVAGVPRPAASFSEAIGDNFATQSSTNAFLKLETNCPPPNFAEHVGLGAA